MIWKIAHELKKSTNLEIVDELKKSRIWTFSNSWTLFKSMFFLEKSMGQRVSQR